jgi:Tfp pilus assembly protein PilO
MKTREQWIVFIIILVAVIVGLGFAFFFSTLPSGPATPQ